MAPNADVYGPELHYAPGTKEYEFTMPATDVTITPLFKEKNIKNTINQIISNPETRRNFMPLFGIMIICIIIGFKNLKKEKIS